MAVREVHMPGSKTTIDPKTMKPQDPAIDWEKKANEMEARQKYALAAKELKTLESPPPPATPADSGIKVKGEINLGEFDMTQQLRDAQAKMEEVQKKYEDQISSLSQESDHYRDQVNEIRMAKMEEMFRLQLDTVLKRMADNGNRGSVLDEINRIKETASVLGLAPVPPAVTDASLQLQILKMNNDNAREAREFEWKMKQDEWMREAKLKEIEQNGMINMEKIKQEREKLNMLATIPEQFGMAFARGLLAGNAPENPVANQPNQKPQPQARPVTQPGQQQSAGKAIEAGEGESGEIECEQCHEAIMIGPESTEAVCPGCSARYPVRRRVASG